MSVKLKFVHFSSVTNKLTCSFSKCNFMAILLVIICTPNIFCHPWSHSHSELENTIAMFKNNNIIQKLWYNMGCFSGHPASIIIALVLLLSTMRQFGYSCHTNLIDQLNHTMHLITNNETNTHSLASAK